MESLFINNQGAGFADYVEVAAHTTVQKLFEKQMPDCKPEDYLIRVNRQPAARDEVLKEGDRVSFTPTKIEGAKCGSGAACRGFCAGCASPSGSSCTIRMAQDEAVRQVGRLVPVVLASAKGRPRAFMGLNLASTGPVAPAP